MSRQFLFHSRFWLILPITIFAVLIASLSKAQTSNNTLAAINGSVIDCHPANKIPIFLAQEGAGISELPSYQKNKNQIRLYIKSNLSAKTNFFSDLSEAGHAITVHGNVHVHQVTSIGGYTAMNFDGDGDYLSITDKDDWNFGKDDFTIDLWLIFADRGDLYDGIFSTYNRNGKDGYWLYMYDGTMHWASLDIGLVNTGFSSAPGKWTHIAVVRHGDTLTIYVDGKARVSKNCSKLSFNSSDGVLVFGRLFTGLDGWYFKGDMDGIMVTKGIARWTDNFTPPESHKPNF